MSATLEPGWLDTIDFRGKFPIDPLELNEQDYDPNRALEKRMTANKMLAKLGVSTSKDMKDVAKAVLEIHLAGTQTLVVLNTVERAKAVYTELEKLRKKSATPKLLLVHSRYRPHERKKLNEQLQDKGAVADRIILATQVVEAGVDISSRTLITELAPWASIVQRIGRCNRTGDDGPGRVFWIALDMDKQAAPYEIIDLAFAREQLTKLDGRDVSPKALDDFKRQESIILPFEHKHVLRRRDLLDLFDTAPDLSGSDIDVHALSVAMTPTPMCRCSGEKSPVRGQQQTNPSRSAVNCATYRLVKHGPSWKRWQRKSAGPGTSGITWTTGGLRLIRN